MNNKIKIILVGGPCSGKTTLCKMLSEKYKTTFIDEILMKYMIEHNLKSKDCTSDIILQCMKQQAIEENESYKKINDVQFCEGTSFSGISTLYSKELEEIIKLQLTNCKQIFLCDNNIPYINTAVRPNHKDALDCHKAIVNYLNQNNLNYVLLSGSLEERIKIIDNFIKKEFK